MELSRKQLTASFIAVLGCGLPDPDGYVTPITQAGTHFVFTCGDKGHTAPLFNAGLLPTALLMKEEYSSICFWALEEPIPSTHPDLIKLIEVLGMAGVEEPLPAPGVNDWTLVIFNEAARYSLETLTEAYLTHEH